MLDRLLPYKRGCSDRCTAFRSCFNHPYTLICNFLLKGKYCICYVGNLKIRSYYLVSAAERLSADGFEIWMNKVWLFKMKRWKGMKRKWCTQKRQSSDQGVPQQDLKSFIPGVNHRSAVISSLFLLMTRYVKIFRNADSELLWKYYSTQDGKCRIYEILFLTIRDKRKNLS